MPAGRAKMTARRLCRSIRIPRSAAITNAIIQMGHGLGLQVLAEGVETAAQRDHLLAQGCDAQQGLLSCGALPVAEFEDWLRSRPLSLSPA